MNTTIDREHTRLIFAGGACGVVSVLLYAATISLSPPESPSQPLISLTFLIGTSWPIVGVVYSYALYRLIALERQGVANRFAFLLSMFALATVTAMIAIQLAVQVGVHDHGKLMAGGSSSPDLRSLFSAMRFIDLGLDVAWDLFMGWSMLIAAFPMYRHSHLGPLWAVPSFVLGLLLIGLNAATFPWPPASRGLFDIGPVVGLYMLLLGGLMLVLGWSRRRYSPKAKNGDGEM